MAAKTGFLEGGAVAYMHVIRFGKDLDVTIPIFQSMERASTRRLGGGGGPLVRVYDFSIHDRLIIPGQKRKL